MRDNKQNKVINKYRALFMNYETNLIQNSNKYKNISINLNNKCHSWFISL